ncbi:MAG: acylneuraminate cytidylyltransferase family protein [Alphaproteobacteria bacterium]|nr:acylneuraminate cytidylyltransferase family protein [Alphaproteobacteria bacterium]
MTIAAVILARGGSKRLPGKNVRPLCGKPLVAYTIDAALGAKVLDRVIVSTDDPEIARVAAAHGAEVPFMRPAEFATDHSPPTEALAHAADWLDRSGPPVDAVVLLQATSPMRRSAHIDGAVALFRTSGVDTVTSVSPAPAHPYWCWKPHGGEIEPFFSAAHIAMSRSELPPALIENGAVYVFRRSLLKAGTLYGARVAGYVMDAADAVDVDTLEDFEYAEFLLGRRAAQRQQPR